MFKAIRTPGKEERIAIIFEVNTPKIAVSNKSHYRSVLTVNIHSGSIKIRWNSCYIYFVTPSVSARQFYKFQIKTTISLSVIFIASIQASTQKRSVHPHLYNFLHRHDRTNKDHKRSLWRRSIDDMQNPPPAGDSSGNPPPGKSSTAFLWAAFNFLTFQKHFFVAAQANSEPPT